MKVKRRKEDIRKSFYGFLKEFYVHCKGRNIFYEFAILIKKFAIFYQKNTEKSQKIIKFYYLKLLKKCHPLPRIPCQSPIQYSHHLYSPKNNYNFFSAHSRWLSVSAMTWGLLVIKNSLLPSNCCRTHWSLIVSA